MLSWSRTLSFSSPGPTCHLLAGSLTLLLPKAQVQCLSPDSRIPYKPFTLRRRPTRSGCSLTVQPRVTAVLLHLEFQPWGRCSWGFGQTAHPLPPRIQWSPWQAEPLQWTLEIWIHFTWREASETSYSEAASTVPQAAVLFDLNDKPSVTLNDAAFYWVLGHWPPHVCKSSQQRCLAGTPPFRYLWHGYIV